MERGLEFCKFFLIKRVDFLAWGWFRFVFQSTSMFIERRVIPNYRKAWLSENRGVASL